MKKFFLFFTLVIIVAVLTVYTGYRYGNWGRTFTMPDTEYSIFIPGIPSYGDRGGDVIRHYVYYLDEKSNIIYLFEHFSFANDYDLSSPYYTLRKIADEEAQSTKTNIANITELEVNALPAIDVVYISEENNVFTHSRLLIHKNKFIQIVVDGLQTDDKTTEVKEFQESFKIATQSK